MTWMHPFVDSPTEGHVSIAAWGDYKQSCYEHLCTQMREDEREWERTTTEKEGNL